MRVGLEIEELRAVDIGIANQLPAVVAHGTLLMKGSWFCPEGQKDGDAMFFRATYAATPLGDIKEGVRRFGEALRDVFGLEKANGHANGTNGHA